MSPFQKIILLFFVLVLGLQTQAQVGINTENPDASAVLELESTSQGFLPPRMTADQRDAIVSPATGLILYCRNCGPRGELQIYNGFIWTNAIGGVAANETAVGSDTGSDSGSGLTAAPTPNKAPADVISVYSDAYTSNATELDPFWGQATDATEIQIEGNNTLKYAGLNYQGLQYPVTDVSAMEFLHLDYKTDDATALDFFLISTEPLENAYTIPVVTGSWQSIDIPLTAYTVPDLTKAFQFKTVGNGTVHLDNMYFWKAPAAAGTDTSLSALTVDGSSIANFGVLSSNYSVELPAGTTVVPTVAATTTDTNASAVVTAATSIPGTTTIAITAQDGVTTNTVSIAWTLDPKPQTAAPIPSQDSADVISVYSDAFTENIATNLNPDWGQGTQTTEVQIDGNNTLEYENLNYQGLDFSTTDVSAMEYLRLHYYTNDATALDFYLISTGPKENAYSISVVTGSWQSIDIPLSAYTVPELDKVFSFKTEGNGTVWFDNIYFWKAPAAAGTDTSLSALTVDGSSIADFEATSTNYSVELPAGTTVVPTVAATTTDTNASAEVTDATSIPGTTSIAVTAQDGSTTSTISIAFTLEPTDSATNPTPTLLIEFNNAETFVGQGGVTYSEATDPTDSNNTVGKMEGGGAQFSSLIGLELDTYIDMTTSEKTITFEFYTTEAVPMKGLLQLNGEENGGNPIEMSFTTDGNIGWETITLDFNNAQYGYPNGDTPVVYGQYAIINIFSNFGDEGSSTYYIDAIKGAANGAAVGSDSGTDPDPGTGLTAAPTPNKAPADVISVYSDAYTSNATELDPFWGQQTDATEIQIEGNNTLKYANLNYQGLQYPVTDVSAMEFLHLDYKTDDATALDFFLISTGPLENAYTIPIVTGSWQSIDIPLTAYTVPDLTKVFQFKTVGNGTVYLDNMYFWKAPSAAGTDTSLSALTVDGSSIANFGVLSSNYSVELPAGTTVVPTVAATTTDTNASAVVTAATSIPGTTTIAITAQDGVTTNTVSIAWTLDPKPQTAAPVPSQDSADVISVYSDAYTSIATNLNPFWGQTTNTTEIQIEGNNTLEYENLNYQGLDFDKMDEEQTDVSAMEFLHLDYYTDDATALDFYLISAYANFETAFGITIVTGDWQSIDIPLSAYKFPVEELEKVFQFKTVGNGTVWFDNIYFWKAPAVAGTELSDLTLDGSSIADFGPTRTSYSVEFPFGTTAVPTVAATPTDTNASAVVTDATSIPGTTTIDITAQDGVTTNTVSIAFSIYPSPTTAAPTPSQDSADVISVYSDAYTSNATNLNPDSLQQTNVTEIQIAGNNMLEYANHDYQEMEYPETDVSAMDYVHLDYYTNDATPLVFYLTSANPYLDSSYSIDVVTGSWQSIDIPLSVFTANLDRVFKFKSRHTSFSTWGNGTVWFDNMYFWKAPAAAGTDTSLSDLTLDGSTIADFEALKTSYSVELHEWYILCCAGNQWGLAPKVAATTTDTNASAEVTDAGGVPGTTTIVVTAQDGVTTNTVSINWTVDSSQPPFAAPVPSQDSADVISVYSDAYTSIATNLDPFWGQQTDATEIQIDGNNTLEYANLNYQGLEYPQTDVSAMDYVHLDYFTDDATALEFFLISASPSVENAYSVPVITGNWQSVDIPLSVYNANLDRVFQFKTEGDGTVYLDNLYFWKAPAAQGTDTSLSALTVDGSSIAGFGPTSTNYSVELPAGTTVVPTVAATTTNTNASAVVTAATSLPGTTTVVVTAQDGSTTSTVSIAWTLASTPPNNTSAPPTPNKAPADVISVYSDAYTSIATNLNPNWGQQTQTTEIQIDGNNILKYENLNYQGLEYPQTDVSAMEYVHLDYFTNDATALDFYLLSAYANFETAFGIPIVTGSWQSVDIPLSAYNFTVEELEKVFQFKTVGNGTVWFDNIYFWKAPAAAGKDTSLSALTVDGSSIANFGVFTANYSVELPAGTTVAPTVAATTTDTNASAVVTAATSIPGTTTIAITSQDGSTTSTVSIAWTLDPKPQTAAPTPSQDSADVISVYSDAYTSIASNLNPNWGQQTQTTEVQIDGNNTLEYANLNYQGLDFSTTDVSAMNYVHLDYYTTDANALEFYLISANPTVENAFSIDIVTGGWQSIDIPLSVYIANLDRVFQFKTVGDGTVWFDNIYFW